MSLFTKLASKAGTVLLQLSEGEKTQWMADNASEVCLVCRSAFSMRVRRHHCRVCYRLVCGQCSPNSVELEVDGKMQPQRVCNDCFAKMEVEQGISISVNSQITPDPSQAVFSVQICCANGLPDSSDSGLLGLGGDINRPRQSYVNLYIGPKLLYTSRPAGGREPAWNENFRFQMNVNNHYVDYLNAELWMKRKGVNNDELVGRCRVPLYQIGVGQVHSAWHPLKKSGSCAGSLALRVVRDGGPEPKYVDADQQLHLGCIPNAVAHTSRTNSRQIFLVDLFPKDSSIFRALFHTIDHDGTLHCIPANERVLIMVDKLALGLSNNENRPSCAGVLLLTTHRLVFIPYQSNSFAAVMQIPLAEILHTSVRKRWRERFQALEVLTKDGVRVGFGRRRHLGSEVQQLELFHRIQSEILWRKDEDTFACRQLSFKPYIDQANEITSPRCASRISQHAPIGSASRASVMLHGPVYPADESQLSATALQLLKRFDIRDEYKRLGFADHPSWRVTTANEDYRLCNTYPPHFAVPSEDRGITDKLLKAAAQYRCKGRIPAGSWIHPITHATLCRSSQPFVGITGAACPEDETLLMAIRATVLPPVNHPSAMPGTFASASWTEVREDGRHSIGRDVVHDFSATSAMTNPPPMRRTISDLTVDCIHTRHLSHDFDVTDHHISAPSSPTGRSKSTNNVAGAANPATSTLRESAIRQLNLLEDPDGSMSGADDAPVSRISDVTQATDVDDDVLSVVNSEIDTREAGKLRIYDARPELNANGNALMGKGYESIARLGGPDATSLTFLNIANIHVMRDSYAEIRQACSDADQTQFFAKVHESKWLHHIAGVLKGASTIAKKLHKGDPVLVHCSDGWDRTSQLCSLAELLLDPYYRTIVGFRVLIEKDWIQFGHRFNSRTGADQEQSPIFLQFLDCVWQVSRQYPWEFEFNDALLVLLVKAAYSRWFSDFMFDSKREAEAFFDTGDGSGEGYFSVWDYVAHNLHLFRNVVYKHHPESLSIVPTSDDPRPMSSNSGDVSPTPLRIPSPELPVETQVSPRKNTPALLKSGSFSVLRDRRGSVLSFGNRMGGGKPGRRLPSAGSQSRVTECLDEKSDSEAEVNTEADEQEEAQLEQGELQGMRHEDTPSFTPRLAEGSVQYDAQFSDFDTASPQSQSYFSPALLERLQQFPVCLILPRTDVPYLGIWEAVLYRGLPVAIWDAVGDHALVASAMREQCLEAVLHSAQRERDLADQAARAAIDQLAELKRQLEDSKIENLLQQERLDATQAELAIVRKEGRERDKKLIVQQTNRDELTRIMSGGLMIDNYL